MHAAYPWNITQKGLGSSRGSLLGLHLNVSFTPHAWTPRDLCFSLTGNWCMVWDPPHVAQLSCLTRRCLRTRQHILMRPMPDHSSTSWARRLQGTSPRRSWDPAYVAPRLLAVNEVRGLVGTTRYLLFLLLYICYLALLNDWMWVKYLCLTLIIFGPSEW